MAQVLIKGWKEVNAALAQLETKVQRKVVRGALRAGAQRILGAAIENIIQNPSIDTGKLSSSLRVRSARAGRGKVGMVILTKGASHANLVEYGTERMSAEPFLRPAGYGQRDLIEKMLIDDITAAIKNPAWKFQKEVASYVTHIKRRARKVATKNRRAKRKR